MSIFDILVTIFIERHFTKLCVEVLGPFMKAQSGEEAKAILKENGTISKKAWKTLFKQVSTFEFDNNVNLGDSKFAARRCQCNNSALSKVNQH